MSFSSPFDAPCENPRKYTRYIKKYPHVYAMLVRKEPKTYKWNLKLLDKQNNKVISQILVDEITDEIFGKDIEYIKIFRADLVESGIYIRFRREKEINVITGTLGVTVVIN